MVARARLAARPQPHSRLPRGAAELGIVGLLLIGGCPRRRYGRCSASRSFGGNRAAPRAASAFLAAAYDWVWQLADWRWSVSGCSAPSGLPCGGDRQGRLARCGLCFRAGGGSGDHPRYVVLAEGSHLRNSQAASPRGTVQGARSEASRKLSSRGQRVRIFNKGSSPRPKATTARRAGRQRSSVQGRD
jgi:hypothetical protein